VFVLAGDPEFVRLESRLLETDPSISSETTTIVLSTIAGESTTTLADLNNDIAPAAGRGFEVALVGSPRAVAVRLAARLGLLPEPPQAGR
jgi:hypothetical protein